MNWNYILIDFILEAKKFFSSADKKYFHTQIINVSRTAKENTNLNIRP